MSRGYVAVKGKACNGKRAYLVKGKLTYKGKKAYIVKGGKTYLSWSGKESGEMVITESGIITIPTGVHLVDIFCVGGGGGAGGWNFQETYGANGNYTINDFYGGGGGGGYTSTAFDVEVTPGESLTVTIGAGGKTGKSYYKYSDVYSGANDSYGSTDGITDGGAGGTTSVKRGTATLCTANGGSGGTKATRSTPYGGNGGDGGSGGCGGGYEKTSESRLSYNGGTDGGDGDPGYSTVTGGSGQGYTTRAFEEANGTLYASGGDGAGNNASATANSGDGANVAIGSGVGSGGNVSRYGGSGVVIIRWKEREV